MKLGIFKQGIKEANGALGRGGEDQSSVGQLGGALGRAKSAWANIQRFDQSRKVGGDFPPFGGTREGDQKVVIIEDGDG